MSTSPKPRRFAPWAATAALASGSALAVAIAGMAGFHAGRGDADARVRELLSQQTKIDQLTADLEKARAERERLDAELRAARSSSPPTPRPSHARHATGTTDD
jgi:hypothetical protein